MLAEPHPVDADQVAEHCVLPTLTPVLVTDDHRIEGVLRTARSSVAMLVLQRRAAQHDAPVVAIVESEPDLPGDVDAARQLLEDLVAERVGARRRELADELEQERASAATLVIAAQAEAAELVAAASDERLQVLLAGLSSAPSGTPSLRVVSDRPPVEEPTDMGLADPEDDAGELVLEPSDPGGDSAEGDGHIVPEPMPAALPLPTDVVPSAPGAPLVAPSAVDAGGTAALQMAALAAATQVLLQQAATGGVPVVPVVPAQRAALPAEGETRGFWGRWLYVDVLLPMIAVVIVLVVLLAWVG